MKLLFLALWAVVVLLSPISSTAVAQFSGQLPANTVLGNTSASAAVATPRVLPSCADSGGNHLNYIAGTGFTCGTSSSGGTVLSVGLSVPATSIFGVTGSPVTNTGTLGLTTTGTSGGVPYFSSGTQLATSAELIANLPVFGGGAGAAPVSGTRSGNTTQVASVSGSLVSGNGVVVDANGNLVDATALPNTQRLAIGWPSGIDPTLNIIATVDAASTVRSIVGTVSTAVGATATVSIYKAASGVACGSGTVLHSGSFNANGTANTNQTLTVTTSALSAGDRICLVTSDSSNWTAGSGIGGVTVRITTP